MQWSIQAIWLAVQAVDMRIGIDGLALHVQNVLGRAPCNGEAYVFCNSRRNRIKLMVWDGNGVWCCVRRLHRGHFTWTNHADASCSITQDEWEWLIRGVDWTRLHAPCQPDWKF